MPSSRHVAPTSRAKARRTFALLLQPRDSSRDVPDRELRAGGHLSPARKSRVPVTVPVRLLSVTCVRPRALDYAIDFRVILEEQRMSPGIGRHCKSLALAENKPQLPTARATGLARD